MNPTTQGSVLDAIVMRTRLRLAEAPPNVAALERAALARRPAADAVRTLTSDGTTNRIIAEIKRRSPSLGALNEGADAIAVARTYAGAGAAAISVLTEPERFGGSFADLGTVSDAVSTPTLCKDFIVDPRQVLMARAHGASLVLLIVAAFARTEATRRIAALRADIEALGMTALVEVHDVAELDLALAAGARVVGVNSRDLRTLRIDLAVAEALGPRIPPGIIAIAESGIQGPRDIGRLRRATYRAFLVGSSLMTAPDPGASLRALIDATDADADTDTDHPDRETSHR